MRSSSTRRQFIIDGGKTVVGASALGSLLAACGGSPATPSGPKAATITFWALGYVANGGNAGSKLWDSAVAAFKKMHPEITVNMGGYTADQVGLTKLTQAVQSGTVDLFRTPSDLVANMIQKNLLAPIDDYLTADDKKDIHPQLLDSVKSNGKHYAWPLWVPPVGMYLNLDVFKERGVTPPTPDWTYAQFVDIAQKLTFTRSNGQKVYGFTGPVDAANVSTWPIIMGEGGGPLSKDNKSYTFNSPESISGVQKLVDLALKYKVTPPDFGAQAGQAITDGFSKTNTYAMYSSPSGDSIGYKAKNVNFDVVAMPVGSIGTHLTTGGIGEIVVTNTPNADRVHAAQLLAHYLTSAQVQQDVPGYYQAPAARESVTVTDPISKFTPYVAYTWLTPLLAQWPDIRNLIHPQLQKAILGQLSVAAAMNAPASEINTLLAGS